jgi:hypothetical protein
MLKELEACQKLISMERQEKKELVEDIRLLENRCKSLSQVENEFTSVGALANLFIGDQ